jgi:hypothetical protein
MTADKSPPEDFSKPGFKQFLSQRKEMLDRFDSAFVRAQAQKVQVHHGKVAEASFRAWLGAFLPTRFGVTSGYIISNDRKANDKLVHFDVIIYDQIESPILWLDDSADLSHEGTSKAIPVEHVYCVLEVKSQLSPTTMKEAIEHLSELRPFMGTDKKDERYKVCLPDHFCCGVVFFNLAKENEYSESTLLNMVEGSALRGFFGGIALRGEGHTLSVSGRLQLLLPNSTIEGTIGREKNSILKGGMSQSKEVAGRHYSVMCMWGQMFFAQFAFDLIAMMNGKYQPGMLSSFYGFGVDDKT